MNIKRITFYVGPNGCGKTRALVKSAKSGIRTPGRAIAIANTPFVRFPRSRDKFRVFRVSPAGINRVVTKNLDSFFYSESRSTFEISNLLKVIGFRSRVELEIKLTKSSDEYLEGLDVDRYDLDAIYSTLAALRSSGAESLRLDLSSSSDSFTKSLREQNRITFKYISVLKRIGVVSKFAILFNHVDRGLQRFEELSSGEQTLISTFLFIKSNLQDLNAIFIDEPENSLHPEWQRRYVEMLHMALGYNETQIVLATHSPVLVSGTLSAYKREVEVLKIEGDHRLSVDADYTDGPESVEEILWEAFDTITPVSHFLSVELSNILQDFTDGEVTHQQASERIEEFKRRSYDDKQQELLTTVLNRLSEFIPNA